MTLFSNIIPRSGLGVPGQSFDPVGAWALSTYYKRLEVVTIAGSSYTCIVSHTSDASTEPGVGASWETNWTLLASVGENGASGGLNGGLFYGTRAEAIADTDTGAAVYIGVGPLLFEYDANGTALTTGDARTWSPASGGPVTPLHFGAVGNGTTGDSVAWQAMLDWLADTSAALAIADGSRRIVDLMGLEYLLEAPLFIGSFDFNLDGTPDYGTGPISGVKITNGKLIAYNGGSAFIPRITGEIGNYMIYVGVTQTTDYSFGDGSGDMFQVLNIAFEHVEFDCNFETGGIWIENTHRVSVENCTLENFGIGCFGIATCIQSGSHPRGVTCKNQETVIDRCRFEGNLRTDGIADYEDGRDAFGGGAEICAAQAVPAGNLTLNGADTAGGEWISPSDIPFFVEIQTAYVSEGADREDVSGTTFTITGFADAARTVPVSETLSGPLGGRKVRWVYSVNKYAVITSIASNAAVAGTNADIIVSTSYKAAGIVMRSHDFYITNNVFTTCEYAMIISGRAGQIYGNHPWSRQILVENNAKKLNIFGNYFDYTDVTLVNCWNNQIYGNGFIAGSCDLQLVATSASQTAGDLLARANKFTEYSRIEFLTDGGSWQTDALGDVIEANIGGNTFEVEGDYAFFGGYVNFNSGAQFRGNVTMGGNQITNMAAPTADLHAATKKYVDDAVGAGGAGDLIDGTQKTGDLWLSGFGRFDGALNVGGYATHDVGGSFGGNLTMGGFRITDLATPSSANDAARKAYVDSQSAAAAAAKVNELVDGTPYTGAGIDLSGFMACGGAFTCGGYATHSAGGSFGGTLTMGANQITNVGAPTAAAHAATKAYVDAEVAASDYRLKTGVQPLKADEAISAVSGMQFYSYTMKATGVKEWGVLAHELAPIVPEAVLGEFDGKEMQRVRYERIVPALTRTVQDLLDRIEHLEAQINGQV